MVMKLQVGEPYPPPPRLTVKKKLLFWAVVFASNSSNSPNFLTPTFHTTHGAYLSVTLLFLFSLFLFPRPYLQPSDGSSPCDGASANRARGPHAGERELGRRGAERSAASPPIHRPPSLPIRRALRRIPSHLAARLAPSGALSSHGDARRGSKACKSTCRAAN
jgi:hypothetical protein